MAKRIVACQGPIQLVTAVAVLRQRDRELRERASPAGWEDWLVIMELAAPAAQEEEFVRALKEMAGALRPWKEVSRLQDSRQLAALEDVGEVYVVREWQQSNRMLLEAFPAATRICFGDAIGIYLAPTYMAPTRGLLQRIAARLRRGDLPQPTAKAACYYLTLPDGFDPVPARDIRRTDTALLRQAIEDLVPLVPSALLAELRARLGDRKLVVIVTSNFSEQGVMSQEAEVAAYMEYIDAQRFDADALVLLKPHPRDRREKASDIASALRQRFGRVFTLSDALVSYLPLEALALAICPGRQARPGLELCTFSTACLAAKYLLGVQPRVGFGARAVKRYFQKQYIAPRLHHEAQLLEACRA